MKLNNISQIRAEDFPDDMQDTISRLGGILNQFMQQVVELSDNRVDFENKVEIIKTIEVTVDSNGKPLLNDKISVDVNRVRGINVIKALNFTNGAIYPISHPFISFTQIQSGILQINNITGLQPNNKYNLVLIVY